MQQHLLLSLQGAGANATPNVYKLHLAYFSQEHPTAGSTTSGVQPLIRRPSNSMVEVPSFPGQYQVVVNLKIVVVAHPHDHIHGIDPRTVELYDNCSIFIGITV